MNWKLKAAFAALAAAAATQAAADVTLYENDGFRGRVFTSGRPVGDLGRVGFNDRASSVIVDGGPWEVCEDARYGGRCMVLRPGSYDSLNRMGLNDRITSIRPAMSDVRYDNSPAPLAAPTYEYRRRPDERLYDAHVTSVRAVMGPPERRCWVERQQVETHGNPNIGGAVLGGIIGGVLGHQIGGGRGQDVATAGGALAGAAIGANAGRDGGGTYDRDVRRCENTSSGPPAYWDVAYEFQGVEHRTQMNSPPGATITVNRDGVPRG